jgi:hypothetical protein
MNDNSEQFVVDASAVNDQNKAHLRILEMINRGTNRASFVIDKIMSEVPVDYVVPARSLHFSGDSGKVSVSGGSALEPRGIHRHALRQMAEVAGMPLAWADRILGLSDDSDIEGDVDPYGAKLLAHSLNEIYKHSDSRHLMRCVGDVRGFLSDRYRRIDSRPIMERLFTAMQNVGLRPYDGYALDTKVEVQAIIPKIYSPYPGELVAFGLTFRSSDYGDGALDVRGFTIRPACANGMIRESMLRQVHLGGRLSEDLQLSTRTYNLDTETMASATFDVVNNAFSDAKIEREMLAIRSSQEKELDPKRATERLRKVLSKGEAEQAIALFASADIVTMPPGQTEYRMSNALSWLANNTKDERRKIEIQEIAGDWISKAA